MNIPFSRLVIGLSSILAAGALVACSSDSSSLEPAAASSASMQYVGNAPVFFTEIDPVNASYKDYKNEDPAWVELYNPADTAVNLAGLSLTDARSTPRAWIFGNVTVAPHAYKLVFLSGENIPDEAAPSDSASLIGTGVWGWADSQNSPVAGTSVTEPFAFAPKYRSVLATGPAVSAQMQLGPVGDLGWTSASFFVGTGSSDKTDVMDISNTNELLLMGYVTTGAKLSVQFAQSDMDDWLGWGETIVGTGDSTTTYSIAVPAGTKFPDLANIYGIRFSPPSDENKLIQLTFKSIIARNRGHKPHASFEPSKKGGVIYLTNTDGNILDSVAYSKLPTGKSWALGANGWGYAVPSPEGFNAGNIYAQAADAVTNIPLSGFYAAPFTLTIAVDSGATVHYELGGKLPTEASPIYTAPIAISATTVFRCITYKDGELPSAVTTRTYVFETAPTLPAVFITADPGTLFDPDSGIYEEGPNAQTAAPHYGANYWKDTTIAAVTTLIEPGATSPGFEENAGFEIFGNYSRMNPKKSVALKFKETYGESHLKYKLFPEYPGLKKFKDVVLRSNGGNNGLDYIRDVLGDEITKGLGLDYQKGRPAIVYYNGEYYGIHWIRERSNDNYFETEYGLDPNTIDLLKADNSVSAGSAGDYNAMLEWMRTYSVESDSNYAYIASLMDIDNYINYMQTEMYIENRDWPANNLKKWRSENPASKWKWFLYDLDFGFDNGQSAYSDIDMFSFATAENDTATWPNGSASTELFRLLLKNASFKAAFINRYPVLLATNFSTANVTKVIDALTSELSPEIARDQDRWNYSVTYMESQEATIRAFAQARPAELLSEMQTFFGLGSLKAVTLSTSGAGSIAVHGLTLSTTPLSVEFFQGFPVLLTATPREGAVFSSWSDGETAATRWVDPAKVDALTATFKVSE